jgi:rubredoxin
MAAPEEMYQCQTVSCGYIYNPDKGDRKGKIPKGTPFEDRPDDWRRLEMSRMWCKQEVLSTTGRAWFRKGRQMRTDKEVTEYG